MEHSTHRLDYTPKTAACTAQKDWNEIWDRGSSWGKLLLKRKSFNAKSITIIKGEVFCSVSCHKVWQSSLNTFFSFFFFSRFDHFQCRKHDIVWQIWHWHKKASSFLPPFVDPGQITVMFSLWKLLPDLPANFSQQSLIKTQIRSSKWIIRQKN